MNLASFTFLFFYVSIFEQDLFGHVPDTLEVDNTDVLDFLQIHILKHLWHYGSPQMLTFKCSADQSE